MQSLYISPSLSRSLLLKFLNHRLHLALVREIACTMVNYFYITIFVEMLDVLRALQDAVAQCDDIGLVFGISYGKIEAVQKEKSECKDRLKAYVAEWLKGNTKTECTWASLCEVLRDPIVRQPKVADKIAADKKV